MKRFASSLLVCSILLLAAPAASFAKGGAEPSLIAQAQINLVKGYHYYIHTVGDWLSGLTNLFTASKKVSAGELCEDQSQCTLGLACLNACAGGEAECDDYAKRCVPGPSQISVIGAYGACDQQNVCAKHTACQRVCPEGAECALTRLCLPEEPPGGSCVTDAQCLPGCLAHGLPPVGGLALRAVCATTNCICRVEAINPGDPLVPCAGGAPSYACPNGTRAACTTGGRPTCLVAPEFGGHCIDSRECAGVRCPGGLAPFCDDGAACRCRGEKQETVSCTNDSQCGGITCAVDQKKACVNGVCNCATIQKLVCKTDAECAGASCPSGYVPACSNGGCACQRTVQAPVVCGDVSQCGNVSCPTGYSKACVSSQCACTRTRTE